MHLSHCLFVALHNQFGMAQLSAHWHNSKTNDREREITLQTETPMVVCLVQRMEKKGFEQAQLHLTVPLMNCVIFSLIAKSRLKDLTKIVWPCHHFLLK